MNRKQRRQLSKMNANIDYVNQLVKERATKTFDLAWETMDTHLYESIRKHRVSHDRAIKIMGEFQTRLLEEKEKGLSANDHQTKCKGEN